MSYVSQLILVPFVPRFLIEVVTLLSVELVSTTDKLITKPTDHTRCEQWVQTSLHFCSRTEGDHMALGERDQAALGDGAHAALGEGDHAARGEGDHAALREGDHTALGEGDHAARGEGDHAALGEGDHTALGQVTITPSNSSYPPIPSPQLPPLVVVVFRRSLSGEDGPPPLVNEVTKRQEGNLVQGHLQQEVHISFCRFK